MPNFVLCLLDQHAPKQVISFLPYRIHEIHPTRRKAKRDSLSALPRTQKALSYLWHSFLTLRLQTFPTLTPYSTKKFLPRARVNWFTQGINWPLSLSSFRPAAWRILIRTLKRKSLPMDNCLGSEIRAAIGKCYFGQKVILTTGQYASFD